jgi:hypothetical protein
MRSNKKTLCGSMLMDNEESQVPLRDGRRKSFLVRDYGRLGCQIVSRNRLVGSLATVSYSLPEVTRVSRIYCPSFEN